MMPAVMAENSVNASQYDIVAADDDDDDDDDRDEKERYVLGVSRPEIICRNVTKNSAELNFRVRVRNKNNADMTGIVAIEVEDQEGNTVAIINDKIDIPAGQSVMSKSSVRIKNPHIHSVDSKYRYEAEVEVLDYNGEEISRDKSVKFWIANGNVTAKRHPGENMNRRLQGRNLDKRNAKLKLVKEADND